MADDPGAQSEGREGDVTVYRPAAEGGLEAAAEERGDYRERLRSRRWDAAPLANPEVEQTDPRIALAFIAALLALTFVLLVVGYWTGFWG